MQTFIKTLPKRRLNPALKDPLYLFLGYSAIACFLMDFVERVTR